MKKKKRKSQKYITPSKKGGTAEVGGTSRPFSLLIKPAGPDCNLRCEYCFYLPKRALFEQAGESGSKNMVGQDAARLASTSGRDIGFRMSPALLERMIHSYLTTPQPVYTFNWQGGEPTLMGLDFFRSAVELQKWYAPANSRIVNTLQTNATLLDREWARFLSEQKFLVGVSLDGPEDLHDVYRVDAGGRGTFRRVMDGIELLSSAGAEFNILTMVTSKSFDRAGEIFDFFVGHDFRYLQFIPCVEFDSDGRLRDFSVDGKGWGRFLTELFETWYPDYTRQVSIRNFDSIVDFLARGSYNSCTMRGRCDQYFVVEHNGNVYPCDFFVEPQWLLGNIREKEWEELYRSPLYRKFGSQKSRWNSACRTCPYLYLCSGDCLKMRFSSDRDPVSLSRLCEGWRYFFDKTLPRFDALAEEVQHSVLGVPAGIRRPPVGADPEAPCFCGSGKKLKNCHRPGM
jgi:uncharacterized protein